MEKIPFGNTGLEVSRLGFGGAEIGYLETEQKRVADVLNFMLDHGVNVIDTAANYLGSEESIAKAIGHRRDEFVLISKCGTALPDVDAEPWSATMIERTVDRSLRRLNTDRLDVMLLHTPGLDVLRKGEALGALVKAREAGKVRFVGYSGDNEAGAYAAALPDVAVIQTSVSICDQANIEAVLPHTRRHGQGVMAKRPIANAAWRRIDEQPGMYKNYAATYTQRFARLKLNPADLGFEGDPNRAWAEIALRFTLSQPGVHTAIIGTTNLEHVRHNIEYVAKGALGDDVVRAIRSAFQQAQAEAGETWSALT